MLTAVVVINCAWQIGRTIKRIRLMKSTIGLLADVCCAKRRQFGDRNDFVIGILLTCGAIST